MTAPIGTLKVAVVGDVRKLGAQIARDANKALTGVRLNTGSIGSQIDKIAEAGTKAFAEIGRAATESADLSEGAFADLGKDAQQAARKISTAFDKAGRDVHTSLGGLDREAAEAGRAIGSEIAHGGEVAERALKEVGNRGEREFGRIAREARTSGASMLSSLTKAAVGIGAVFAAVRIGHWFIDAAQDAEDLGSAIENTQQIIKATGGAAQLTAQQVRELSRNLGLKIGVDSVEVQNAANVLLTFREVAGSTFTEAIALAADMSAVLGTDLSGAALQVGKALNDPIRGVTALSRAGVTFNDQQREQIKGLVAAGKTAAAQVIILAELRKEFGGVAAAGVDTTDQLKSAFLDLKREAGSALIEFIDRNGPQMIAILQTLEPVLSAVGGIFADVAQAALPFVEILATKLRDGFAALEPAIGPAADIFSSLVDIIPGVLPFLSVLAKELLPPLAKLFGDVAKSLTPVIGLLLDLAGDVLTALLPALGPLTDIIREVVAAFAGELQDVLPAVAEAVVALVKAVVPLAPILLEVVEAALPLIGPLADIVAAVAPLIAALAPLIELLVFLVNVPLVALTPLLDLLAVLLKPLTPLIKLLADGLAFLLKPLESLTPLVEDFTKSIGAINWGEIGSKVGGAFTDAWHAVVDFFEGIGHWFAQLGRWFADLPGKVWDAIKSIPHRLEAGLKALPGLLARLLRAAFDRALEAIGVGIGLVLAAVIGLPKLIVHELRALNGILADLFKRAWHAAEDATVAGVQATVRFAIGLPKRVVDALKSLGTLLGETARKAWHVAEDATARGVTATVNFVMGLPRRALDALKSLGSFLAEAIRTGWARAKIAAKAGLDAVVDFFRHAPERIAGLAGRFANAGKALIRGLFDGLKRVGGFLTDVGGSIVSSIKGALNAIIGKINEGIAKVDDKIPFVDLPRIPRLARGGLTQREGLAALHPSELVLPLEDRRAVSLLAKALEEANRSRRPDPPAQVGNGTPQFDVKVFLGTREIEDVVRVEISESNRTLRSKVRAGTRRPR